MAIKRPGAKRPAPLGAGTQWRTGQATKFVSRCKGGFPAGGNFFACPVAASKRGCPASGLRSDQPIWTARGAPHITTDQGWKAMMEPGNCHGRFFQMLMSPARLHSASNVGRVEANALLYRSRRTVECRWILFKSPETAMIPTPLTNHPCQSTVASQVQTTSGNSVSKPLSPPSSPAGNKREGLTVPKGGRFNRLARER